LLRDLFERARLDERELRIETVQDFASGTHCGERIAVGAQNVAEIRVAAALVEFENDGGRRLVEIDERHVSHDANDAAIVRFWIVGIAHAFIERALAGEIGLRESAADYYDFFGTGFGIVFIEVAAVEQCDLEGREIVAADFSDVAFIFLAELLGATFDEEADGGAVVSRGDDGAGGNVENAGNFAKTFSKFAAEFVGA
jgi:hypothetical protein